MKIGVLSLQGAVREHINALKYCGVEAVEVKKEEQFAALDGLIIPGGESTTIGKLINRFHLEPALSGLIDSGKPVYGTCAGMIMLAREVAGSPQYVLGKMDIVVARNAFGRQKESFEKELNIPVLGSEPFRAVFIRAPLIAAHQENVDILAHCNGEIVAARQKNLLVTSFHPELTEDNRVHGYFVQMALDRKKALVA